MRQLIPICIGLLLFLAVLRVLTVTQSNADPHRFSTKQQPASLFFPGVPLFVKVIAAQLLLPVCLFFTASLLGLSALWVLALTLVAAASPISGSPNLVQLLGGDDELTLRWLIAGTAILPFSCVPVMYLLFPAQSPFLLLIPSLKLLILIGSAVLAAVCVSSLCRQAGRQLSPVSMDGAASLILAIMVIGLMSGIHAPGHTQLSFFATLLAACAINGGLQLLGALTARVSQQKAALLIATGVVCGNRNIALFLAALPLSVTEPLLLFIACYQVPMYLTPLLGGLFYKRLR